VVVALVVAAAAGVIAVVWGTGLLGVRSVQVTGVPTSVANQVRTAAAVPEGRPLARVDAGAVERRVLERLDTVGAVEVTRAWPSTLRIAVTPRRSVGTLVTRGEPSRRLDPAGVTFGPPVTGAPAAPTITLLPPASGSAQRREALASAASVAGSLPRQLRLRTERIEVRGRDDVRLVLRGNRTSDGRTVVVRWGGSEESARKALVLSSLLRTPASAYDVSAPDLPTSTPLRRS
jgi:cell division protein FtsQ